MTDRPDTTDKPNWPVRLSDREQATILEETFVSPDLVGRIRLGWADEGGVVCLLTLAGLDELIGHVAAAANHAETDAATVALEDLHDRLTDLLRSYERSEAHDKQRLAAVAVSGDDSAVYASGLTGRQIITLVSGKWSTRGSGIWLNHRLTVDQVQRSAMFGNGRVLIEAIDAGDVEATDRGYLNRRSVTYLLERLDLPPGYVEGIRSVNKVINEQDVWPLHVLRAVLEAGEFITLDRRSFEVSDGGRSFLWDELAGEAYARLFEVFFRTFDLAYLDRLGPFEILQATVPVCLYVLSHEAPKWRTAEHLVPYMVHPRTRRRLPERRWANFQVGLLEARVLKPLASFGLLQMRQREDAQGAEVNEYRKTDLFDEFLRIEPGPAWGDRLRV